MTCLKNEGKAHSITCQRAVVGMLHSTFPGTQQIMATAKTTSALWQEFKNNKEAMTGKRPRPFTNIHRYMYICIYTYVYVCVYMHLYAKMFIYIYIHIYLHMLQRSVPLCLKLPCYIMSMTYILCGRTVVVLSSSFSSLN